VTRNILIVGLVLLAVFLPLAAIPVVLEILGVPFVIAAVALFVSISAPPVPLLAVTFVRGPPSR
jgi:hypothetical protein